MTIRLADLSGSDWSDGEVLYADDLNDTLNEMIIHRKTFTQTTEFTTQSATWTNVTNGSFTITNGLNALILGLHVKCDAKVDNDIYLTGVGLKISGTNLGSVYPYSSEVGVGNKVFLTLTNAQEDTVNVNIGSTEYALFNTYSTTYKTHSTYLAPALKLLDETTTFQLRSKVSNALGTAAVDEMAVEVIYVSSFKDD